MKQSESGKKFLLKSEGWKTKAYLLQGIPHIGVGQTWWIDEKGKTHKTVLGMVWSDAEVQIHFDRVLAYFQKRIDAYKLNISQNKFDALFSTLYQVGEGGFKKLMGVYRSMGDTEAFRAYYKNFRRQYDPARRDREVNLFFQDGVYITSEATAIKKK